MLYLLIGLVIGIAAGLLILLPKTRQTAQLNEEIQLNNEKIKNENSALKNEQQELLTSTAHLKGVEITMKEQMEEKAEIYYQKAFLEKEKDFKEKITAEKNRLVQVVETFDKAQKDYQEVYLTTMSECTNRLNEKISDILNEIAENETTLEEFKSRVAAAIEAAKRAEETNAKADFYKLILSDQDLSEIDKIKSITPYLRDPEPLNKIVYKTYYEKPYTDLVGRLMDTSTKHCGIYKITSLKDNKTYIGQSVDLKERLRQHIKAGLGINSSSNKLYTAMKKEGVHNFTFEILEECTRDKLNDKEKYWISFYQSDSWGFNMTSGGS